MARQKTNLRLPPDLIEAGHAWAEEAGCTFTRLVEDSLRDRLGHAPESVEYRLEDLRRQVEVQGRRLDQLESLAERQGAV